MGGGTNVDDFYTLASARQAYKNHLKVVTSRKNTINGKVWTLPAAFHGHRNLHHDTGILSESCIKFTSCKLMEMSRYHSEVYNELMLSKASLCAVCRFIARTL